MTKKLFLVIIFASIVLFLIIFKFIQPYQDENNLAKVNTQEQSNLNESVDGLTQEEKIYGLSLIWKRSSELFGLWELLPNLDWDRLYQEYIGKVTAAETKTEYYDILSKFVANLEDGHSGVSYPDDIKRYYSPISVQYIKGKFIVYYRNPELTKIPLGSEIIKINNLLASEYLKNNFSDFIAIKTPLARESILAQNISVSTLEKSLALQVLTPENKVLNETIRYGDIKPLLSEGLSIDCKSVNEFSYSTFRVRKYENGIYQIIIHDFQNKKLPKELQSFLDNGRDRYKGFIIDVRSHNGGDGRIGIKVLSNFIDSQDLNYFSTRKQYKDVLPMAEASRYLLNGGSSSESLQKGLLMLSDRNYEYTDESDENDENGNQLEIKKAEFDLLDQPVVILCDYNTGSAGEDFVSYAKNTGRFTVIGTNTRGTTGNIAIFPLPGGGNFYISTYRCVTSDGMDITNNGIAPDIWSEQGYEDLMNGIDTQLKTAIEYLENRLISH